jgi:outer membrane protein OmpA-like peptidoglycan-associated protein
MDRSAQIVALLSFLFFSLVTYGQKPVKQGLRASAYYYLQGIEVQEDSSQSQYSWMNPNDRAYVLGEDTTQVQEETSVRRKLPLKEQGDSLVSAPILTISDSVAQTISPVQDSLSTAQAMDSLLISVALDSQSIPAPLDSISTSLSDTVLIEQQVVLPDTLSMDLAEDSLNIMPLVDDSIVLAEVLIPPVLETDTVRSNTDSTTVSKALVEIPKEQSRVSKEIEPKKSEVLIKSNLDLFGNQEISQTPLDTLPSRRRLLGNPRTESIRIIEQRQVTQPIIMPTQTKVIERTVEQPATYTGEYAGLSEAERERQLRLDAENARKVELEKLELEKKALEMEEQGLTTSQIPVPKTTATDTTTEASQATSTPVQGSTNILPLPIPVSSMAQSAEKVVIVQRDTITEKAVEKMGQQLKAISRKDSIENAKLKAEMKLGQIRVENRIGRIESKIDTLINALGQRTTMDKTEFKESSEDMDVYFAVNSHFITEKQRESLGQYLDEARGKGEFKVVLSGYADNSGDASYNKMLVEKRIGAVKKAIEEFGINPTEILINNYGKQKADTSKTYNPSDRKVTIQLFSAEN